MSVAAGAAAQDDHGPVDVLGDSGGWGQGAPGTEFAVTDAAPGAPFLLMTGQPYGKVPVFNGPYVD